MIATSPSPSASPSPAPTPLTINVRDFGALGDGLTDDSEAIALALREGMQRHLPVQFPAGTYVVNQSFTLDHSVRVFGQPGSVIKGGVQQSGDLTHRGWHFSVTGPDVTIEGLTFEAPQLAYLNDQDEFAAIHVLDAARTKVINNVFAGTEGIMIKGTLTVDAQVVNNWLENGPGITYSYAGASRTRAAFNTIINAKGNAMSGTGNHDTQANSEAIVENNVIINAGRMGIEDWGRCFDTVIRNNRVINTGVNEPSFGIAISAVGVRTIVENNSIDDYEIFGVETPGSGSVVRGNRISQSGTFIGKGTAVIVNSHLDGFASSTQVIDNVLERASSGVNVWDNAGLTQVRYNRLNDNSTGVSVDSQDPSTSYIAQGNTITYNTQPYSGVNQRTAFLTYSTGNTGVKSTQILGNIVRYMPGAWSGSFTTEEWLVKVATDNAEVAGNVFNAGTGYPPSRTPTLGGNGATNTGLVVTNNRFLNGAALNLDHYTNPAATGNTFG